MNACKIVNQHVGLSGTSTPRDIPILGQTANGPFAVDLAGVPGFADRQVTGIRRAWWWDGSTATRLDPVLVGMLDAKWDQYPNDAPGFPRRFWVEGYTLYVDPAPSSNGAFRFMATAGLLAPMHEDDSFHGIPADYDPCPLYIALVEIGKMFPADQEMSVRAQAFTPDAAAALDRLKAWYNGLNNEEVQPASFFDARFMRRGRIRR